MSESDSSPLVRRPKDVWDKIPVLSAFIATVVIPIVIVAVGNSFSATLKESESRVKYVELAISILRAKPIDETVALREWAIDVIARHSAVPLSAKAQQELKGRALDVVSVYDPRDLALLPTGAGFRLIYPDGRTLAGTISDRPLTESGK